MSQLTREIKNKKFRTPQAKARIIYKLIDEVEKLERELERRPILLPNFGRVHQALASKKSYYKEEKQSE